MTFEGDVSSEVKRGRCFGVNVHVAGFVDGNFEGMLFVIIDTAKQEQALLFNCDLIPKSSLFFSFFFEINFTKSYG